MKRTWLIFIFTLFYSLPSFSQEYDRDSLEVADYFNKSKEFFYDDYIKAYQYAQEGLLKADPEKHPMGRIRLLQISAEIEYFYLNEFFRSIAHLNEMRAISEKIDYKRGVPWFNLNLANLYYYQNYYNMALELFEEAMKGAIGLNDTVVFINALTGKADILRRKSEYDSATLLINKGLDYARRVKRNDMQLFLLDDLADIYKQKGMLDSSFYYYHKTFDIAEEVSSTYWRIVSEINLEYLKFLTDKSYDPIPKLKSLKRETEQRNFIRQYIDISNTISEIYNSRGQYREAYNQKVRIESVKDSIEGYEGVRKITELESQYYIHKAQMENLDLIRQNEITMLKLQNRKTVLYFILFVLFLAICMLYIILRKYNITKDNLRTIKEQERKISEQEQEIIKKEKKVIKQKLLAKERKLTEKLMMVYHNNQLLQKLLIDLNNTREMLTPVNDKISKEACSKLQTIINQISLSTGETVWNEFEKSFVEINPGFIKRLYTKHADLTLNETKLCIFLYLNLRTKEISAITQQSIKSINVGRTRLRKKLNINNTTTNLHSYLKQL